MHHPKSRKFPILTDYQRCFEYNEMKVTQASLAATIVDARNRFIKEELFMNQTIVLGNIITMDEKRPTAKAALVKDG